MDSKLKQRYLRKERKKQQRVQAERQARATEKQGGKPAGPRPKIVAIKGGPKSKG